jgi:hypothetical protein
MSMRIASMTFALLDSFTTSRQVLDSPLYAVASGADPDVFAFTADPTGKNLPEPLKPWQSAGSALSIGSGVALVGAGASDAITGKALPSVAEIRCGWVGESQSLILDDDPLSSDAAPGDGLAAGDVLGNARRRTISAIESFKIVGCGRLS